MPVRPLRPLPLAALVAACTFALVAGYMVFVRTHPGQKLDEAALDGRLASFHARHAASVLLTTISVGSLTLAVVLLVGQALLRRRVAQAAITVAVVLGALVVTELLKHYVFARPELVSSSIDHNSFPSGHTTTAFAVGIAAVLAAPPRWRRAAAAGALLYGAAIGVATVAAGWHRPSDVAGAMLVVTGWAALVALVAVLVDRDAFAGGRAEEGGTAPSSWARNTDLERYVLLAVAALGVGWVLTVAIVGGGRVGAIELTTFNAAFVAACACIAALAALLLAAFLTALRESLPAREAGARR
ncbi:MAG: phosphatase PAP2 family protein [Actinobacteria bacterium]|nr:phosphatase PAP2 family protein [Actinomycetota bacterium]